MYGSFLRTLYGSLWRAAIPVLKRHKRLKVGFGERLVPDTWPTDDFTLAQQAGRPCPTLWLQAASGGEATLLFPLIEAFCAEYGRLQPNSPLPLFLCTTCTEQGMDIIKKLSSTLPDHLQQRVRTNFFPLDAPATMRKAIQQTLPDLVVLLETELWPGLMHELKRAGVPYCIVNARMTEKTFHYYRKTKSFFKHHQPRKIVSTTPENAYRFKQVFQMEPIIAPNIKFDIIDKHISQQSTQETRTEYERMVSLLALPNNLIAPENPSFLPGLSVSVTPPLVALASVRQEEENQLTPVVEKICRHTVQQIPSLCLLAPRHLHRIPFWQEWLEKNGIAFMLKSEIRSSLPQDTRCILWDTFGEFDTLYALADVAFVGGSLAPLGGQNFLEPLSRGTSTVIGPSWSNFAWVGEELFTEGLIRREPTPDEVAESLFAMIINLLSGPPSQWAHDRATQKTSVRSKLRDIISHNTGGSRITAEVLYSSLTTGDRNHPLNVSNQTNK